MKKEHVVVILINFNSYRDTKDCVASIKTSTGTKPYIIIIDNDSQKAKDLEQLHSIYKKLQIIYNSNKKLYVFNSIQSSLTFFLLLCV